jgi:transcriptional regulator with XRE-family HTH domain
MAPQNIYTELGLKIKNSRLNLGMTQLNLAEKAGISVSFLSFLESGKRKGSLETYFQIAASLGTDLSDLLKVKKTKSAFGNPRFADLSIAESKAVYRLVKSLRHK